MHFMFSFCEHGLLELLTGHTKGCIVWAGINAPGGAADTLALITCRRLLTNDRDLDFSLDSKSILVAVHGNIAIRTIACAESTADAVILDNDLFGAFAKDRIHWAAYQAIGIGTGSATRRDQEILESQSFTYQSRLAAM